MTPVRAVSVERRFGDVVAVRDVSLEVAAGEVVGLVGANGAGKTTLIRLLLGLLRPTSGEVRLFGATPSRATRRRIGYVAQHLGLYDDLTVEENLAFAAAALGHNGTAADPGVHAVRRVLVRDLPLGLQRRAAFVRALQHRPDLLVLDEPTSGVEPLGRARLWDTVRGAAEAGAAVLVTTHHMDEAERCDRVVVMASGLVVASGTMTGIVGDLRAVAVRAARWDAAFAALDAAGIPMSLSGRSVRVVGESPERVHAVLDGAGVDADVALVPATFEEAFVHLATAS